MRRRTILSISAQSGGSGGISCRWNRSPTRRHWTLLAFQKIPTLQRRPSNSKKTPRAS